MRLEDDIRAQAFAVGFDLVGIAAAAEADDFGHLQDWLAKGHAGEMDYMNRHGNARRHPASILPSVKSVVMVALNYLPGAAAESEQEEKSAAGRVARYAQGADYHDVLRLKLQHLLVGIQREWPDVQGRAVVDTAPLLERDFARRAGLGWIGKNTMLIHPRLGSFFFLGALLLDVALTPDAPFLPNHCGTCTACLDTCPTDAFVGPYQLDARRCISYLTIELRGPIDEELRPLMGEWAFGCDICQDVCPWNRKAPAGAEPALQPRPDLQALDLEATLRLTEPEFRERYHGTALMRPGRRGLLRNAAVVLGNRGDPAALPALQLACDDEDPVIRDAVRWAIDRVRQHATMVVPESTLAT